MGRLKSALIAPVFCLVALSCLAACAQPAQTAASLEVAPQNSAAPQNSQNPRNLIGSTPGILDAEFGQPTLLRVDGTAQIWLYHSASCGLSLFLYPDAAGVPRVTMATTADGSTQIGDCPASLQQSHIDAAAGMQDSASLPGPAAAALLPSAAS